MNKQTLSELTQALRDLNTAHLMANESFAAAEVAHGCHEEAEDQIIADFGYGPELEALEDRRVEAMASREVVRAIASRDVAERRAVDAAKRHVNALEAEVGRHVDITSEAGLIRWARRAAAVAAPEAP